MAEDTLISTEPARQPTGKAAGGLAVADVLLGGVALVAWGGLRGPIAFVWTWLGPALLLVGWAAARLFLGRRVAGWYLELGLAAAVVALGALLPAWPGAATPVAQAYGVCVALLTAGAWRALARVAGGPVPVAGEYGRVFLLLVVLFATWWAYFTPRIVGVVDERWYGDLMADFLGQLRSGVFPVLVGQGEFAWNGNVHPFRSGPAHHYAGGLLDLLTLRQLTPLAVQHLVVIFCEFAAGLILYAGLRRLRPARPWFAALVALLFVLCPAVTLSQIQHDMYMTAAAMPLVVLVALSLVRALETNSWRAWLCLGAALGAVWFCHPPMALLATGTAGATVLFRFIAGPLAAGSHWRLGAAGLAFVATCAGYFVSMGEIPPPWHDEKAVLEHVVVPGLALVAGVFGLTLLARTKNPVVAGLAGGGIVVGLAALSSFYPRLLIFTAGLLAAWAFLWWLGARFPGTGLARRPEAVLAGCAIVLGTVLGPRLTGNVTVDAWLEAARTGYRQLWLPLRSGGSDQLGYVVVAGFGLAGLAVFREPRPAVRALFFAVAGLFLALAPIPGFARFLWQAVPREVIDIIGVAYPLRFLPATAPFCLVLIFLALAERPATRWARVSAGVLLGLLPWAVREHHAVVMNSWRFRHSDEQTRKHLRSENRPISKFHYHLQELPRYHNHGVTDHRLETRLWLRRPGPDNFIGPNEYADRIAAARPAEWQEVGVTQDAVYPAWLYLTPKIVLAPGERRLVTFRWQDPAPSGWLILRGAHLYREYLLPEFGGNRSFGLGGGKHQTLSLWNSGPEPEEVELVIKREGPGADAPYALTTPLARMRTVTYDPSAAPVEVTRLQPLQMRVSAEAAVYVETFRVWLPGYRVSVDGRRVPYYRSPNGLLGFLAPEGSHVADIRFRGTPSLRVAVYWSLAVGAVIMLAAALECVRLMRKPNPVA